MFYKIMAIRNFCRYLIQKKMMTILFVVFLHSVVNNFSFGQSNYFQCNLCYINDDIVHNFCQNSQIIPLFHHNIHYLNMNYNNIHLSLYS